MIITLRTLHQKAITIDIQPEKLVKDLKEKVEEKLGSEFASKDQKLIYKGKILDDETPLGQCNIEENKFIVIMVPKSKAQPPAATDSSKSTSSVSSNTNKNETNKIKPTNEVTKVPTEKSAAAAKENETIKTLSSEADVTNPNSSSSEMESVIRNIMEMGYGRTEVQRALQASFNNPERAVEYLITGVLPEEDLSDILHNMEDVPSNPNTETQASERQQNPLDFLRNQPQFQQMCQVVQQNPTLLNTIMHQLRSSNPHLLQLITQNQESFVRMINESSNTNLSSNALTQPNVTTATNTSTTTAPNLNTSTTETGSAHLDSLLGTANVTSEDKEAIERLKSLGFPEYLVIQAYFACEKNENLAANFLITQNYDD